MPRAHGSYKLSKMSFMTFSVSALARKIKGQGNFANSMAPNARERCDQAAGGLGRQLAPSLNKKLFENKA